MEIRQLRYLCAIAAHGSFRAAASELHIAQPALSQQIARLEAELGVKLFNRDRRPVRLTPAGESFAPHAQQILDDLDQAAAEVREFGGEYRGRVALGSIPYLTELELPELLRSFGEAHPDVEIDVRVTHSVGLRELLLANEIDLALVHADGLDLPADCSVEVLRSEELMILVDRAHPLATARHLEAEDVASLPFILFQDNGITQRALQRAFSPREVRLNVAVQADDMRTVVSLVARGFGAAVVPRSIAEREVGDVAALRIGSVPLMGHVALAWNGQRRHCRALEVFIADARRMFTATATPPGGVPVLR